MSPRLRVSQAPRLRAETHFGVQARALPAGPDAVGDLNDTAGGELVELTSPIFSNTMNKPKIRK